MFIFLLLSIPLIAGCTATSMQRRVHSDSQSKQTSILINETVSVPLHKILGATGIKHDGTLPSVVEATQKSWLRKEGTERWDIGNQFEVLHDQLVPLLKELGVLDAVKPTQKEYDYAVVLGATVSTFRTRLSEAFVLYQDGTRFEKLVVHAGARPLDPVKESKNILFDRSNGKITIRKDWQEPAELPKTETDMVRMVLDQAQFPEGFKESVAIEVVDAPMQKNADGSLRRPNTGDVVKLWLAQGAKPGTVLAISNQPYVLYQHAVLKTLLPAAFIVETVGSSAAQPLHMGVLLDNLARWLYQEDKYQQVKNNKG